MADGIKAIVTGHSRGFGEGIAAALLQREIPVLGLSRGGSEALAAEHRARLQEERLDLSDADVTARWLRSGALGKFVAGARMAVLVNNAGLLQPIGPLQQQDSADVWRAVSVNVGAVLSLSAAFVQATDACELLPRVATTPDFFECRFCPWADRCWRLER